jgi:hypothetical protein
LPSTSKIGLTGRIERPMEAHVVRAAGKGSLFVVLLGASTMAVGLAHRSASGREPSEASAIGQFAPQKASYVLGEPIFIDFFVRNLSDSTLNFVVDENDTREGFRFAGRKKGGAIVERCGFSSGGGWLWPDTVEPGETLRRWFILNRYLRIEEPGTYEVSCEFDIKPAVGSGSRERPGDMIPVRQELQIIISPYDEKTVREVAEGLKAKLDSRVSAGTSEGRSTREFLELRRESRRVKRGAILALGHLHADIAAEYLIAALDDADADGRPAVIRGLARIASAASEPGQPEVNRDKVLAALRTRLRDPDALVRADVVASLADLEDTTSLPDMCRMTHDASEWVRLSAARAIGVVGAKDGEALTALYGILRDRDESVRVAVIGAIGEIGDKGSIPRLEALLNDPRREVRDAAMVSITALRKRLNSGRQGDSGEPTPTQVLEQEGDLHGKTDGGVSLSWLFLVSGVAVVAALGAVGLRLLRRRKAE